MSYIICHALPPNLIFMVEMVHHGQRYSPFSIQTVGTENSHVYTSSDHFSAEVIRVSSSPATPLTPLSSFLNGGLFFSKPHQQWVGSVESFPAADFVSSCFLASWLLWVLHPSPPAPDTQQIQSRVSNPSVNGGFQQPVTSSHWVQKDAITFCWS